MITNGKNIKENEKNADIYQLINQLKAEAIENVHKIYQNDLQQLEKAIKFIKSTARHSKDLHKNSEGVVTLEDFGDESPHDLRGPGNKFETDLIEVMMLDKVMPERSSAGKEVYTELEIEILNRHRIQKHHQVFFLKVPSDADIQIWAFDYVLSLREKRSYKETWPFERIVDKINGFVHSNPKIYLALQRAFTVQYNNEANNVITRWG